jgi:hypothetical protein
MAETLLSPSNVLLFGREMTDLVFDQAKVHDPFIDPRKGATKFLESQLKHAVVGETPIFARIYGFSYEGQYYELEVPAIFLVHGPGKPAETAAVPSGLGANKRFSRAPDTTDRTGLQAQNFSFADELMVWSYDKADHTLRLEIDSGTFEEVLLAAEFDGGEGGPGMSGARVRGARVRGARVRGARMRGARVRGARLRGGSDGGADD